MLQACDRICFSVQHYICLFLLRVFRSYLKTFLFGSVTRHLLTLPSGYRISRGTEEEVVAALETPTETPRVLFIPQWCVDPADPHDVGESSSLDLDDLARKAAGGKAGLCLSHSATSPSIFLGSAITDIAVKDVLEGWREPGGLRGAVAKQDSDLSPVKTRNGLALLRSDAVSPVMVVDLWSAPALFLRHIEVRLLWGWEQR